MGTFDQQTFLIRRKVMTLAGAKFHIFDSDGQVVLFSKLKAYKLREDIRLYSSEDMTNELVTIHARNIIDFSATYDVADTKTGENLGALQRKGLKSILKDEWLILDANGNQIGTIKEDSLGLAMLRRVLTSLVPQKYVVEVKGQKVAIFKQKFNPFVMKLSLDFLIDTDHLLDKRLGIAAGVLLCAIEGRQN